MDRPLKCPVVTVKCPFISLHRSERLFQQSSCAHATGICWFSKSVLGWNNREWSALLPTKQHRYRKMFFAVLEDWICSLICDVAHSAAVSPAFTIMDILCPSLAILLYVIWNIQNNFLHKTLSKTAIYHLCLYKLYIHMT